jgi:hypothetical protein
MSIAMERFGLNEQLSKSQASSELPNLMFPYRLQCRACGYEAIDVIAPPPHCPKCAGHSWERLAFPGSLLMQVGGSASDRTVSRSACPLARPGWPGGRV